MPETQYARLRKVVLPSIGLPKEPRPEVPARVFASRLRRVRERMEERALDVLLVYGDREHFGTLSWLTNYDPRFEEALLVVFPSGVPVLLVGNEGMVYSHIARLPVERCLYQAFSLLGQPREKVRPLAEVLDGLGLGACMQTLIIAVQNAGPRSDMGVSTASARPPASPFSFRERTPEARCRTCRSPCYKPWSWPTT